MIRANAAAPSKPKAGISLANQACLSAKDTGTGAQLAGTGATATSLPLTRTPFSEYLDAPRSAAATERPPA